MLFSQIRQYVKGILANSFINKSTLDKLGENNNGLTFDGNNIESPQELTSQQIQDIKNAFVIDAPRNGYPVLFDETGAEHFIGWYKYANGTKQPIYEKHFTGTTTAYTDNTNRRVFSQTLMSTVNVKIIRTYYAANNFTDTYGNTFKYFHGSAIAPTLEGQHSTLTSDMGTELKVFYQCTKVSGVTSIGYTAIVQYIKTTDTPK